MLCFLSELQRTNTATCSDVCLSKYLSTLVKCQAYDNNPDISVLYLFVDATQQSYQLPSVNNTVSKEFQVPGVSAMKMVPVTFSGSQGVPSTQNGLI
jgi:hypothetical protein